MSTQGTYEFMSQNLVNAVRASRPYLHSPVDDLESFYYTAQWAVVFNDGARGGKHNGDGVREFREMISGNRRSDAILMVLSNHPSFWERREQEYGAFFTNSAALLRPWFEKLNVLIADWKLLVAQAKLEDTKVKEHLIDNFFIYSYRGVAEYFELIHEYRAWLEKVV